MTPVAETSAPSAPIDDDPLPDDEGLGFGDTDGDRASDKGRFGRRKSKRAKDKGLKGFFKELPILVILALGLALLIKTFLIQAFFIPSPSMEPTLTPGDRVLVNKFSYDFSEPHRGDVVVFENPNLVEEQQGPIGRFASWLVEGIGFAQSPDEDFIKRVIGVPGDTIRVTKDGVFVNGEKQDEPYISENGGPEGTWQVAEGQVFVMGDNRPNSSDSRVFGAIPIDSIVGRAFVKIWPFPRVGWL